MSQDIQTLELARIYERQGYYKDAFEIYSSLYMQETDMQKTDMQKTDMQGTDTQKTDMQGTDTQKTDMQETFNEVAAGLKRMEKKMEKKMENEGQGAHPEENISRLFEKWLGLIVLKQRLDNLKKLKSRLL